MSVEQAGTRHVETLVTLVDAARVAQITYRQADYWVHRGFIRCCGVYPASSPDWLDHVSLCSADEAAAPGSGLGRLIDRHEARVLRNLARLCAAGLALPVAARAARQLADGASYAVLEGGVTVRVAASAAAPADARQGDASG